MMEHMGKGDNACQQAAAAIMKPSKPWLRKPRTPDMGGQAKLLIPARRLPTRYQRAISYGRQRYNG